MFHMAHMLAAAGTTTIGTSNTQLNGILASAESFLSSFVLLLGPIVFLAGLIAHGTGAMHNSQKGYAWGNTAMKTGAVIFIGALALNIIFATITSVVG